MVGIPFTYYLEAHGKCIAQIDCELFAEVDEGKVIVTGVYADHLGGDNYITMTGAGDPLLDMLAERISTAAEKSDAFKAEVYEREGIYYVGGANNPSGHFKRYG